jgi:hypothetical protein
VICNNDTVAHVLTVGTRKSSGQVTLPVPVSSGGIISIPTAAISTLVIDTAGTASSVGWFYSDVPVQGGPSGGGGASTAQLQPTNQTQITAGPLMLGLGAAASGPLLFTPLSSGKVLVAVSGSFATNGGGASPASGSAELYYGTGTPPANGAAVTGTAVSGTVQEFIITSSNALLNGCQAPFQCVGFVTGLTGGVRVWFDFALTMIAGSAVNLLGVNAVISELVR